MSETVVRRCGKIRDAQPTMAAFGAWMCSAKRVSISSRVLLTSLIVSLAFQVPLQAGNVDYEPYWLAIKRGDEAGSLTEGERLYTQLAFQARGQGVFYAAGVQLACIQEATDALVPLLEKVCADLKEPTDADVVERFWANFERTKPGQGISAPDDDQGRFLQSYLELCQSICVRRLTVIASKVSAATAGFAADCLSLCLSTATADTLSSQPNMRQAIAWIVASGQAEHVIAWSQVHNCLALACAVSKEFLADNPADPDARKAIVELVASYCRARRTQDALSLCVWAKEKTMDPAFGSVLILQQAAIIARQQKNYGLALHLVDMVATAPGEPGTVELARYSAGVFCMELQNCPEVIRRMDDLAKDGTTSLPYRLKATNLSASARLKSGSPEDVVRLLSEALKGIPEPEPVEAADCRKTLWQTLLRLNRYDEAVQECRVLAARHPGHPSADQALQMARKLTSREAKSAATRRGDR